MFLKSLFLRRDGKNLFSCSNTSKNVFYLIKSCDPLFLFLHLRRLLARKWCKDKASFLIYQIFHCFFTKNFSEPYFFAPRVPMSFVSILLPDCGCKVTANFSNFQMFFTFFSRVFGAHFCMSLVFSCL